jgi:hypothetical protein
MSPGDLRAAFVAKKRGLVHPGVSQAALADAIRADDFKD